jgi:uncharacterized phage protein gp47/JayE
MSFIRPTLPQLIERARADQDARLPGADSRLPASVLDVLARTHAGAVDGLYGYLDWLARQLLPDTAEGEWLERHVDIWQERRKGAVGARGNAGFTGTVGAAVPVGTELIDAASGRAYRTTAAAVLGAGTTIVPVEDVLGGLDGNRAAGVALTLTSPLAGVNAVAAIAAGGLTGGVDEEEDAALRARLLTRIRTPPMGGAKGDYALWTLEVPQATRAWVFSDWMGEGSVGVTFVCDGRPNILPLQADLDAVAAHLDPRRPVTARPVVFAPVAYPIDVLIRLNPATQAVKDAVIAELADFFARDAEPGGTIRVSRLREAVSIAAGELWHDLLLPSENITVGPGGLPVLGLVSWA